VVFSDLCPLYRQLRESWRIILQKLMSHRAQPAGPTVSVIMRSFNHAGYISHAIDSVLNQTITDLELIIVDDASRDRSQEIIRAIGNRDNRIKTILHSSNRGMAAGMNEGMAASTGKFIAFIDSDDIWERDKLEKQLEYLNRQTDCAAVWTEGRIINEQGVPTGETFTDIRWGKKRQKNGDLLHELVNGNFILLSSFLGKAKAVKAHPFWTELRYFNDWAFHFEMSLKHRYAFIPEPLTRYRVHAQSTQQDANGYRNDWIKTHALFLRKFARQLSTCQRSYLYFKMGELSREKGCWFRSCRYMLTAYRVDRSNSDALYCLSTTIKSRFPVLYRIARILMRRGASS
jgi:glycosyltransferase involved in cell wall biosynthesis